jgi:phenylalanyl-tRNA synthetase beta chain
VRDALSSAGFAEAISYSFINRNFTDRLSLPDGHPWRERLVPVLNPLSEDQGVLRPSVLPGLLSALRLNQYRGQWDAALFEVGAVFMASDGGPRPEEYQSLGAVICGSVGSGLWNDPARESDFWDIKGAAELIGETLGLALSFSSEGELPPFYDPAQAALIGHDGRPMGHIGRLSDACVQKLGLKEAGGSVFAFELLVDGLEPEKREPFRPWSNYPGVTRDLAVVLDRKIAASEVVAALRESDRWPLAGVVVFDLYQGDRIPAGRKSLALRLFFQDSARTLTDELVNGYFGSMVETLADRFKAELRS